MNHCGYQRISDLDEPPPRPPIVSGGVEGGNWLTPVPPPWEEEAEPQDFIDDPSSEDELERHELDDRIGDIPNAFTRRTRREALFNSRSNRTDAWDRSDMLGVSSNTDKSHEDLTSEGPTKISDEEMEEKGLRKYAKLILPHVGLVLLTCAYTVIGASIFYSIERPNELATKRQQLDAIYAGREAFVRSMWAMAQSNESNMSSWNDEARLQMHNMSDQLFTAYEKFFLTANEVRQNRTAVIWSFPTAIFFAVTVVTTIGYGNPVPVTQLGRMMCIVFSLFGIPLTLVTIADLGKFLSEHLIWLYGKYRRFKHYLCQRRRHRLERREHVCEHCQKKGISRHMEVIDEPRIPAFIVLAILVMYTALGGVLMSNMETWTFFTSFYWSFITMTTVGFGDLMPRRDQYMYIILLYIIFGLAITTMCIDLVGVQYIRKIHYFGRKIQDARSALAVVGGKVVLVSELYANLMQKRAKQEARQAYIIENLYISKHIIPFIPSDIRWIRYIDQNPESLSTSTSSLDLNSCRFCHSRFSISQHT